MVLVPSDEQVAIVEGFRGGANMVIEAGAGCSKTSSLVLASLNHGRGSQGRGLYMAFNRSVADEATTKFPPSVMCKTIHSIAYGAVGYAYSHRLKTSPRLPAHVTAKILGINGPAWVGEKQFTVGLIASLAMEAVTAFCLSADPYVMPNHVVPPEGLTAQERYEVRHMVAPYAERAWGDLSRVDGKLRYTHNHYRKTWALSGPMLPFDYILLDEGQDTAPVVEQVFRAQMSSQRVVVGDSSQQIMRWAGAVDALERFKPHADLILPLTTSYRFGPPIAEEAAKWLKLAGSTLDLKGWEHAESAVDKIEDDPDVILCRSNAGVVTAAMDGLARGIKTAVVGGGQDIKDMAVAAQDLQAGRKPRHPQLVMFSTWEELKTHVSGDSGDSDLRVLVRLVESHGAQRLIKMVDSLVPEPVAQLTVSTVHKMKGREANRVRIADDFTEPKATQENPDPSVETSEAMLAYVAVTRAKKVLDRGGLAWVDSYV